MVVEAHHLNAAEITGAVHANISRRTRRLSGADWMLNALKRLSESRESHPLQGFPSLYDDYLCSALKINDFRWTSRNIAGLVLVKRRHDNHTVDSLPDHTEQHALAAQLFYVTEELLNAKDWKLVYVDNNVGWPQTRGIGRSSSLNVRHDDADVLG